ncbi:LOW QUALITY PROTEIN: hypothetical protein ACHAWF_001483 [Thalassiosira exigua]
MASADASASGHPATTTARVPATKAVEPSASSTRSNFESGAVRRGTRGGADDEAGDRDTLPTPPSRPSSPPVETPSSLPERESPSPGAYPTSAPLTGYIGLWTARHCPVLDVGEDGDGPLVAFGRRRRRGREGGGGGGVIEPGPSHDFLAWLDGRGQLLRVYTQNIDGFEGGSAGRAGGVRLRHDGHGDVFEVQGQVPSRRSGRSGTSKATAKTTATAPEQAAPRRTKPHRACTPTLSSVAPGAAARCNVCGGTIKPDVTFFGEKLGTNVRPH